MEHYLDDILLAPWRTGVLTTAIRLNVFSLLADNELTTEDIASKCAAKPERLKPLLDACCGLGFLECPNDAYRNTPFSRVYLVEGKRLYIGDFLRIMNFEALGWFQLPDLIRGEEKRHIELPELTLNQATFISAMNAIGHMGEADALKDRVDLAGCRHMTDAGGGSGVYSIALCRQYPELQSTILDVADTLAVTQEFISACPVKNRIHLREGDFLKDPLGENLDAVLLSDVMYGESGAKMLLSNAWNSLSQNGLLIIRGYYAGPGGSGSLFGALFAVKLLVDDPHRKTLSILDLERNVRQAGFEVVHRDPLTERSYLLVGKKHH